METITEIERHLRFHKRYAAFLEDQIAKIDSHSFRRMDRRMLEAWSEKNAMMMDKLEGLLEKHEHEPWAQALINSKLVSCSSKRLSLNDGQKFCKGLC